MTDKTTLQLALSRADSGLDVAAFVRVLGNTTASYKYLLLLALLDRIRSTPLHENINLSLQELALDMSTLAWYPCKYFNLSFGVHDQLARVLQSVDFNVTFKSHRKKVLLGIRQKLASSLDVPSLAGALLRYVPFRFLEPFFSDAIEARRDILRSKESQVDRLVFTLSQETFETESPPLYVLTGSFTQIGTLRLELNQRWQHLLLMWEPVVRGWVMQEWAKFLQSKNPAMPNILGKLQPPDSRDSALFSAAKAGWQRLLGEDSISCIYTGEQLHSDDFALDHFLPWSYVGHDLPWNLVPTTPRINSSKGAKIPSEKYVESLARVQAHFLSKGSMIMSARKWSQLKETYCQDLRLENIESLSLESLKAAYQNLLLPQISLGRQLGFLSGWTVR